MIFLKRISIILVTFSNYISGNKNEFSNHINKPVNILISQYAGSLSHVKFLLEISNGLAKKGHKITYATPDQMLYFGKGYNVTMYNMGLIDFIDWDENFVQISDFVPPLYDQFFPAYEALIKDTNPDVVICDFFSAACVDYCQLHKIPYIVGMQALDSPLNTIPYINDNSLVQYVLEKRYQLGR
ncbi:glycosyltransferase family 1 protein [Conidiobolus coronatus NRRL 28638]|uniref:Glycosyltransferase family 1 protein n=1 Tax=Conidiobolus coronatus (strain ATCC 28846 / CBS 209.66 / NRRL 28638) TaxID=796925 RepID=A0A137PCJ5_CONC2|nr:glycosyltransferase family 1 protein [Conidiobolus coronatus NRRL 28638]|eukprot:KXN72692.1 glycosyltransferase family 1 protein [Conidiobolus coronatus NRRL 28638]